MCCCAAFKHPLKERLGPTILHFTPKILQKYSFKITLHRILRCFPEQNSHCRETPPKTNLSACQTTDQSEVSFYFLIEFHAHHFVNQVSSHTLLCHDFSFRSFFLECIAYECVCVVPGYRIFIPNEKLSLFRLEVLLLIGKAISQLER